jgi:hypothetical protein
MSDIRGDLRVIKWAIGVLVALSLAIFIRVFLH